MCRLIVHGRITRTWAKLQLDAVKIFNPETIIKYEPWMPPNTIMVVEPPPNETV
jgi:hypothetical protein